MDLARQLDVATCVLVPLSGIVHLAAIVTLKLPGPLVLIGVLALSPPLEVIGQATLSVTGSPIQIVGDEDEYFQRPRWSPEGTRVAFTGASYRGIWVADADGSGAKSVTDDPAAGFGFTWSPDASSLLARVARYEGLRRLDAVKVFDVDSGGEELLTDFRDDMPVLPAWTHDGAHVALAPDDEVEILPTTSAAGKTVSAAPLFAIRGERIVRIDPTSRVLSNLPGS